MKSILKKLCGNDTITLEEMPKEILWLIASYLNLEKELEEKTRLITLPAEVMHNCAGVSLWVLGMISGVMGGIFVCSSENVPYADAGSAPRMLLLAASFGLAWFSNRKAVEEAQRDLREVNRLKHICQQLKLFRSIGSPNPEEKKMPGLRAQQFNPSS